MATRDSSARIACPLPDDGLGAWVQTDPEVPAKRETMLAAFGGLSLALWPPE